MSAFPSPYTNVSVRVRSSSDHRDLGEWSAVIDTPGDISDHVDPEAVYMQYMVLPGTKLPFLTPILHEIRFSYEHIERVPE